jgi:hypothetical protein
MRSFPALALLIALSGSADAATVHHSHAHHNVIPRGVTSSLAVTPPGWAHGAAPAQQRLAVPGWTDAETQRWMDNVTVYP